MLESRFTLSECRPRMALHSAHTQWSTAAIKVKIYNHFVKNNSPFKRDVVHKSLYEILGHHKEARSRLLQILKPLRYNLKIYFILLNKGCCMRGILKQFYTKGNV